MRTVAAVLCASERSSASVSAHWCAPALGEDPLRDARVGAGHPGGHGAHVVAAERGGVEEAAQVVAGLRRPERAVFDALAGDRERERVRPADRRRRVLAPLYRRPRERRGDAADELRVEHVHRAPQRADRGGQGEHVGLRGRGDDRAGVAQDHVGQERGLSRPRRGHDQHVLLQGDAQAVPPVRPAEEHRVLARHERPQPQREGRADPPRAAQRGEPAPAQVQADERREALAGVQAEKEADLQRPGPVAGQVTGGQERPPGQPVRDGHQDEDQRVLGHYRSPFSEFCSSASFCCCWAESTARRSAVRADPVFRPTKGADTAQIRATDDTGMPASGPCSSATSARNRAVFVSPPPRPPDGRRDREAGPVPVGGPPAAVRVVRLSWPLPPAVAGSSGRSSPGRPGPAGRAVPDGSRAGRGSGTAGRRPGQGGRRGGRGRPGTPRPPTRGTRRPSTSGPGSAAAATGPARRARPGGKPRRCGLALRRPDGRRGRRCGQRRSACRLPAHRRPGHRPHREVPPARRGRDHVHEHRRRPPTRRSAAAPGSPGGPVAPGRRPGRRIPAQPRPGSPPPARRPAPGAGPRPPAGIARRSSPSRRHRQGRPARRPRPAATPADGRGRAGRAGAGSRRERPCFPRPASCGTAGPGSGAGISGAIKWPLLNIRGRELRGILRLKAWGNHSEKKWCGAGDYSRSPVLGICGLAY